MREGTVGEGRIGEGWMRGEGRRKRRGWRRKGGGGKGKGRKGRISGGGIGWGNEGIVCFGLGKYECQGKVVINEYIHGSFSILALIDFSIGVVFRDNGSSSASCSSSLVQNLRLLHSKRLAIWMVFCSPREYRLSKKATLEAQ